MIYEYPENFARFYDVIYHYHRDSVDNEYFQNVIKQAEGKILEIGVGTGRLFINALNRGADIYGMDISQSMLKVLLNKLPENQHKRISRQNFIDFKSDFRFDLIIAPFRVIMHLLEKNEQLKAINNVYEHLNKNGRFIFDAFIPDLNQLITGFNNFVDFDGEYEPGKKLKRTVSTVPDYINQLINITFNLEWEEENELKREEWQVPLRFFFRFELEHLMKRSKFEKYMIYGDYQGNGLNQNSKEFVVVCQKTGKN